MPSLFDHFQFALIHGPDLPGSYAILLFTASDLASITSHIHNWVVHLFIYFALALALHSFWNYFSTDLQQDIWQLPTWGVHHSVSYLFAFSHCSWGSQGKNTEVVCHSLLQWTILCQIMNSLLPNSDFIEESREKPLDHSGRTYQVLYDYTVEVRNRFKGLDLIECLMNWG